MNREELRSEWRGRISRHVSSGLTVSRFCREEGVAESAFYRWRKRLASAGQEESGFVSVDVVPNRVAEASRISIELPGGAIVHLPENASEQLISQTVRAVSLSIREPS